jgi:hypothetical protein
MTSTAEAYRIAKDADEAFEAACKAAGFGSRWDAGVDTHPDVLPAKAAKVAADKAWREVFWAAHEAARAADKEDV